MIEVIINNESLDLFPDTTIEINRNNPIFNEEGTIEGDYTVPFKLPLTDKNKRIINFSNIIETRSKFIQIDDAIIKADGMPYVNGVFNIKQITDKSSFEAFVSINGILKLDELKTKSLGDIVNKQVEFVPDTSNLSKALWFDTSICVPTISFGTEFTINGNVITKIWNPGDFTYTDVDDFQRQWSNLVAGAIFDAFGGTIVDGFGVIGAAVLNTNEKKFQVFVSKQRDFDQELTLEMKTSVYDESTDATLPMLIIYTGSYLEDQSFLGFSHYNDLMLGFYNPYLSATPPDDILRLPILYFDEDERVEFFNAVENGVYNKNEIVGALNKFLPNEGKQVFAPCVTLSHLLTEIETLLGFTFSGFFDNADFQNLILFPTKIPAEIEEFPNKQKFIRNIDKYDMKDYVPVLKLNEFIKNILVNFGAYWIVDSLSKSIEIVLKDDIISSPDFVDITDKCSPLNSIEKPNIKGYNLKRTSTLQVTPAGEAIEDDPYLPFVTGEGEQLLELNSSSFPPRDLTLGPDTRNITYIDALEENTSHIKYLFYDGIQVMDGDDVPTASMKSASFNLSLHGANGLVENFHKLWVNFLINRSPSKCSAAFTISDLLNFDFKNKYRRDRVDHLVKSVRTTLTMQGIKPSTLELFSIDLSPNDNTEANN